MALWATICWEGKYCVSVEFLPAQIGELVDRAAEDWGDREALVSCHQGIRKTYGQV